MGAEKVKNRRLIHFTRGVVLTAVVSILMTGTAVSAEVPKEATAATKAANDKLLKELPFNDMESFKNAHKGLVAPLPETVIKGKAGNVIWDQTNMALSKKGTMHRPR